jgi:hypothetical protein
MMDSMDSMMDTPFDERLMEVDEKDDEEEEDVVVRPSVSSTSIPLQPPPPPPPMPPRNNNDNNKRNNNDDRNAMTMTVVVTDGVIQRYNDQPVSTKRGDTNSSIFLSTTNVTSLCNTGVAEDSTVKDKLVEEVRIKDNDSRLARYQRVRTFALWKEKMKIKSTTTTATTWCENSSGSKVLSSTKSSAEGKIALAPTFSSSYDDDDDDDYDKNPVIRSPSSVLDQ